MIRSLVAHCKLSGRMKGVRGRSGMAVANRGSQLRFSDALHNIRSGKIMLCLLRDIAAGRQTGDTTTLEDFGVLAKLREEEE